MIRNYVDVILRTPKVKLIKKIFIQIYCIFSLYLNNKYPKNDYLIFQAFLQLLCMKYETNIRKIKIGTAIYEFFNRSRFLEAPNFDDLKFVRLSVRKRPHLLYAYLKNTF